MAERATAKKQALKKPVLRVVRSASSPPKKVAIDFTDAEPLTKQSFKHECDINRIMRQYVKTGIINHGNRAQATYGDVPSIDFRQAMDVVLQGEETFASLPSALRKRFDNSPVQYLAFCEDPENYDEAVELGLAEPPPSSPEEPPEADPPQPPSVPAEDA